MCVTFSSVNIGLLEKRTTNAKVCCTAFSYFPSLVVTHIFTPYDLGVNTKMLTLHDLSQIFK